MALIMLGFMAGMYPNRRRNLAIVCVSVAAFATALWLVRSQGDGVGCRPVTKAMIPHHSIAITDERSGRISDPRVQKTR